MAYVNFNRTKTLEEALVGDKDTVYFTTDSKLIVLNGVVYGGDVGLSGIEADIEELQTNKQDKVTIVSHTDATATIQPNVYNVFGSVTSLTITKGTDIEGVVNNYMIRFTAGTPAEGEKVTLTLDWGGATIKWYGGSTPEWASGMTYEISIVNNIALWAEFEQKAE